MTEAPATLADWTRGHPAIVYQECRACGRRWTFHRGFCPHCGGERIEEREASGRGVVYAATLVSRAPSDALRALAPYRIRLVDADEGFRFMAHGALDLAIGEAVAARFAGFGPHLVPFFERRS